MEKQDLLKMIKHLRTSEGLTHQQMATKLGWGKQTYERIENGRTQNVGLDDLIQIAGVFGLTVVELVNQATPEGTASALLKEAITLFREAQTKVEAAEQILEKLSKNK
ncbi:helix-turn-helix transcriptional regulator [uncultured Microscilla sp.]|uniref:helix-turn-helix domain-containing protein n=1 Tax=uncultured Microscilla sp. TaxID=432653 RepID=UPI002614565C|nr:helix-turn-helix transcriptional regulator [uncultured Microscilla sp.]